MRSFEGPFVTSRDVRVHTRTWEPDENVKPKAVFVMTHGLSDYLFGTDEECPLPSFHARAKVFTAWGAVCTGIEFQGHGRSEGLPGFVPDWNALVDDVEEYVSKVVIPKYGKTCPIFVVAESMGGGIGVLLGLRPEFKKHIRGMVLMAPLVSVHESMIPPWPVVSALRWAAWVMPTAAVVPGDSANLRAKCSPNMEYLDYVMNDDLIYKDRQRLGTGLEVLDRTAYIQEHIPEFDLPVLVLHGKEDTVSDPQSSVQFVERIASKDKAIKLYDDMWHTLLSQEDWCKIVYADILKWIEKRL